MKFCQYCGAQLLDEAVVCPRCGCPLPRVPVKDDTMQTVIKVFLILGCIAHGTLLLPLAWCIPMTVSVFRKMDHGETVGTGMKVCVLLFVNLIAGIMLLCSDDI